jgi:hypothetical protein
MSTSDEGGDPACWLQRLCPSCDAVLDDPPPERCPRCDTELDADER